MVLGTYPVSAVGSNRCLARHLFRSHPGGGGCWVGFMIWRISNVLGGCLFAVFAWLQREDDNPDIYANPSLVDVWTWIALYGLVSVLFLLAAARRFPWPLLVAAAALCVFELGSTAPGILRNLTGGDFTLTKEAMNPAHAEVEQSREFLGVVISLAALGVIAWQRRIFLARTRKAAVMGG